MVAVVNGCLLEILYVGLDFFVCSRRLTKRFHGISEVKGLSRGQEVISSGGLVISSARGLIVNPSSLLIASTLPFKTKLNYLNRCNSVIGKREMEKKDTGSSQDSDKLSDKGQTRAL